MHAGIKNPLGISLAITMSLVLGAGGSPARGDEPGIIGRLFRLGGGSQAEPTRDPAPAPPAARGAIPDLGAPPPGLAAPNPNAPTPSLLPPGVGGAFAPTTTPVAGGGATQRIRPQPRVSHAATEAEPILTRVALGRADDGNQFGMFLQVYADGTVIDGEGVHRVGADVLRPLMQLLQTGELSRATGHCGGPPTDFIEQVHVVVYERRLGGLRAVNFSYSGNPAGCDNAIRQLHQIIEQLQARVSSPGIVDSATATNASAMAAQPGVADGAAPPPPLIPTATASSISLTPVLR